MRLECAIAQCAAEPFRAASMSSGNPSSSDEAFTIERHGDLTVITATRALEQIEFGLEEQVADMILKPLQRQENPLIVFDLSQVDNFGSMFLALLIRCWKLAMSQRGDHGPLGGDRSHTGITAGNGSGYRLADL